MTFNPDNPDNPYNVSGGLDVFLNTYPNVQIVFVQWLDWLGQMRSRCLPIAEFAAMIRSGERIRIALGNTGTLQNDGMTSNTVEFGSLLVEPDRGLLSLRPMQNLGPIKNAATVMAGFADPDTRLPDNQHCPRSRLQLFVEKLAKEHSINFLVGFEIEVTFCRRNPPGSEEPFAPFDTTHAWGTFSDEQYTSSYPLMIEIMAALRGIGIAVQQMHSESGPGQYEFILPPLPPVYAVDTLIQARQCISQIAATRGLRATYYPMPFLGGAGNGAHAHFSFNSTTLAQDELEKKQMFFLARIMDVMPILFFVWMTQAASYERVADRIWTMGTWCAWATDNREVPLRKVGKFRWELRCLDGCANMYLAMVALFCNGYYGLRDQTVMKVKDAEYRYPGKLTDAQRQELGITQKLPTSLRDVIEAVRVLSGSAYGAIEAAFSLSLWVNYSILKKGEQEMLDKMSDKDRRIWLMERY